MTGFIAAAAVFATLVGVFYASDRRQQRTQEGAPGNRPGPLLTVLWALFLILTLTCLALAFLYPGYGESKPVPTQIPTVGPSPSPSTQTSSATEPTATSEGPSDSVLTLSLGPVQSGSATLVFGQLRDVVAAAPVGVSYDVPPELLSRYPERCVTTVLMTGLQGDQAIVYAEGYPTGNEGWSGAEFDPADSAQAGTPVHQQLISPPAGLTLPYALQLSASASIDDVLTPTNSYTLKLLEATGQYYTWQVGDAGQLVCQATAE